MGTIIPTSKARLPRCDVGTFLCGNCAEKFDDTAKVPEYMVGATGIEPVTPAV